MKRIVMAALLFTAIPVHARIGETYKECVARYGNGTRDEKDKYTYFFSTGPWDIMVSFNGDIATSVMYTKKDETMLTRIETRDLMHAEGADKTWKMTSQIEDGKPIVWRTTDDDIRAIWSSDFKTLLFDNKVFRDANPTTSTTKGL